MPMQLPSLGHSTIYLNDPIFLVLIVEQGNDIAHHIIINVLISMLTIFVVIFHPSSIHLASSTTGINLFAECRKHSAKP
jgi:hypothetical protein